MRARRAVETIAKNHISRGPAGLRPEPALHDETPTSGGGGVVLAGRDSSTESPGLRHRAAAGDDGFLHCEIATLRLRQHRASGQRTSHEQPASVAPGLADPQPVLRRGWKIRATRIPTRSMPAFQWSSLPSPGEAAFGRVISSMPMVAALPHSAGCRYLPLNSRSFSTSGITRCALA